MTTPDILNPRHPILIVDDEKQIINTYNMALRRHGFNNTVGCTESNEALTRLRQARHELVILDLTMPGLSGEELLSQLIDTQPDIPVIIVTGRDTLTSAVDCMKKGACDYLVKPAPIERLIASVRNAMRIRQLETENKDLNERFLSQTISNPQAFSEIITRDPLMLSIFRVVEAIARTPSPVLITGETGVGKELLAKAIHSASGRSGSFVAVNVAGLDDAMFSDTLFGHKRGAFTGADSVRKGLIATAALGTLFLDEIGDLALTSQVKLLRLLQEQEYMPLGHDATIRTDARLVVATNANLSQKLKDGSFRADLYFRLTAHQIRIPPLRERLGDIPLIVDHLLTRASTQLGKRKPAPPRQLTELLARYSFPGNVRELEAMLMNAVSRHSTGMLSLASFKDYFQTSQHPLLPNSKASQQLGSTLHVSLFGETLPSFLEVKKLLVDEALKRANGNRTRAAELLGTTRQALSWHLRSARRSRR
jgi:DNA-binding NtrC family response regulator